MLLADDEEGRHLIDCVLVPVRFNRLLMPDRLLTCADFPLR